MIVKDRTPQDEQDIIENVKKKFNESYNNISPFLERAKESHKMYLGKQWSSTDERNARLKRMTTPNINIVKKNVDTFVGIQRQIKTALAVKAEEPGDNRKSGIANFVLHHEVKNCGGYQCMGMSLKSTAIHGLGWVSPYMDFSRDPENGELKVENDSVFDIFFDPHFKQKNLSDCRYIVRRKVIDKLFAELLFPEVADRIRVSNSDYRVDPFVNSITGLDNKVLVRELWERRFREVTTIFLNDKEFNIGDEDYEKAKEELNRASADSNVRYREVKRKLEYMNLTIVINDNILVYDGQSPYDSVMFPFIPIFGFFDPEYETWDLKLQGLVEPLKDIQREKNRWRANMMYAMNSMIHSGWIMDKQAVDDTRILQRGMFSPIIEVNPGKRLDRIQPMEFPQAFANMESLNDNDMIKIGLNPEMLGAITRSDSGKAIKLRMMQGLSGFAEITDNYNEAMRNFGLVCLSMVFQTYSLEKIKRIAGLQYQDMTPEDVLNIKDIQYDIDVDETTYNATHKMQVMDDMKDLLQYGVQGLTAEMFFEFMELDPVMYQKLSGMAQQQQAQQMQMAQQQQQMQDMLTQMKIASEQNKGEAMRAQSALMSAKVIKEVEGD